jgi:hypothetical protein
VLTKDHLAKVLVSREKQRRFSIRHVEHHVVGYGRRHLRHVPYLMAVLAKALDNTAVNALIGYEVHLAVSAVG